VNTIKATKEMMEAWVLNIQAFGHPGFLEELMNKKQEVSNRYILKKGITIKIKLSTCLKLINYAKAK